MKATKRSGRCGKNGKPYSTKHNDRNFDHSQDGHIDSSKVGEDKQWKYYADEPTFEDCELRFYRENYEENQNRVNENYKKSRHAEKQKSIEQIYRSPKLCPEDEILQIGSLKSGTIEDKALFEKMVMEYATEMTKRYGSNMHILDIAFHYDEATPHCHIRKVYDVTNAYGMKEINQNQALKELGFELPKPQSKEGKYNNRKISFDNTNRQIWYDIIESHGIKLDREPVSPKQFNKDFITFKYEEGRKLLEENQRLKAKNQSLLTEYEELTEDVTLLNARNINLKKEKESLVSELKEQKQANEELKQMNEDLVQQVLDFKKEYEPILDLKRQLDLEITDKTVKLENLNNEFEKLDKRLKQIGVLEEHESTREIDLKVLESRMKTPKKNIGIDR